MDIRGKTAEVRHYYGDKGHELRRLLQTIMDTAAQIKQELGQGCIRDVYSRGFKQSKFGRGDEEFKAAGKIARLLLKDDKLRGPADVDDLMGLMIVVHYADQIERVEKLLQERLQKLRIISKKSTAKRGGYYATHLNFRSEHPDHWGLPCEVQVKTMLHDSWAWKTHDLTYKPRGQLDRRFGHMMGAFSDGLQALEQQSLMLRDIIEDRWRVEEKWRSAVRQGLFDVLPQWADWDQRSEEARVVRKMIDDNRDKLAAGTATSELIEEIRIGLLRIPRNEIIERYLLEAKFAILRDREPDRERAIDCAWECFEALPRALCADAKTSLQVWGIPLVLQACGDTEGAISIGRRLLEDDYPFEDSDRVIVMFNLANHLIEDTYVGGMAEPEAAARLQMIDSLLKEVEPYFSRDPSALRDAQGMRDVVFGTDPQTIRNGIRSIELGRTPESDDVYEVKFAETYYQHNALIAWHRLREAEAIEIMGRVAT